MPRVTALASGSVCLIVLLALCVPAAWAEAQPARAPQVRVVVSIPPLKGLVEPLLKDAGIAISGTGVDVLIPPGVSEHGYEIPPSKLAGLNRADLVVMIGLGLEPQVDKMLKDRPRAGRRVVIAGDVLGLKPDEHGHAHEHAPGEKCDGCAHGPIDPHVWLDPLQTQKIVSAVAEQVRAIVGKDAEASRRVWLAEESLLAQIKSTHERYQRVLSTAKTRSVVVGHDAWRQLGSRYQLDTVPIKGLTASEPTPESMSAATKAIREHGARAVCIEPQLSKAAGERIAQAAGVQLLTLDPLGSGDWFGMMESNLRVLAQATGAEYAEPSAAAPARE